MKDYTMEEMAQILGWRLKDLSCYNCGHRDACRVNIMDQCWIPTKQDLMYIESKERNNDGKN
jgi:hypothetical protein